MITEDEFRAEALAFLEANAKRRQVEVAGWGKGSDGVLEEKTPEEERAEVEAGRSGASRSSTPASAGSPDRRSTGRELTPAYERLYQSIEAEFDTPSQSPFGIGLGMVAPTILAHATDKVKDAYLRKMYRGEIVGCQLFSEPGAGLRPGRAADQRGSGWRRVDRHRPEGLDVGRPVQRHRRDHLPQGSRPPKHKGLTGFVVDMHTPGSRCGRCAR